MIAHDSKPDPMKILRVIAYLLTLGAACVGFSQNTEKSQPAGEIDQIVQSRSAAGDFNGAVLVGRNGEILYQRAFGFANVEWKIPNDLETKFEIGSMTKQFTALLVLQFVNEGKIHLDGHISDYLPFYRRDSGSRVTVTELLSHASGIPNFTNLPGFLEGPASRTTYAVRDFVEKYCSGDLHFEPGTKFEYSNSGYFVLGAVLEQVSGKAYEQLLKERIFEPLGMRNSGYAHSEEIIPHRAAGYERAGGRLRNARFYDMSIPFDAGAMYSTVGDLWLWDQALYGERLLPARLRDSYSSPILRTAAMAGDLDSEAGFTLCRRIHSHAWRCYFWISIRG